MGTPLGRHAIAPETGSGKANAHQQQGDHTKSIEARRKPLVFLSQAAGAIFSGSASRLDFAELLFQHPHVAFKRTQARLHLNGIGYRVVRERHACLHTQAFAIGLGKIALGQRQGQQIVTALEGQHPLQDLVVLGARNCQTKAGTRL